MSSFDPYTSLLLSDTSLSHGELDPCSFLQEDVLGAVTSPSTPGTPDGVVNSSSASSTSMGSSTSESMVMASPSKVLASPWTAKPARVSNPLMSPSAEDFFLAESLKGSSAAAAAAAALPTLALAQSATSAFPHLVLDSSAGGLPAFAASLNSGVANGSNGGAIGNSSASSASSTSTSTNSGSGSGSARSAAGMLSSHSAMNEESDDEDDDDVHRRPKARGVKRERSAADSDSDSDNSDSHADDGSQPSLMRPTSCSPSPDGQILMGSFGGSASSGCEVDAKKLKLAHKAELARRNRRRKKMRMADLEREVNMLKEELERERKRRKVAEESLATASARPAAAAASAVAVPAATPAVPAAPVQTSTVAIEQSLVEESRAVHDAMVEATRNPSATPERTAALIQNLVQIFRKKNQVTSEHLNAIKNFLSPAVPLRFLQWIMAQQDRFYQDENGLWSSLFKHEVGLSAEQMRKVLSMRETVRTQTNSAADVARAYEHLSQTLDGHLSTSAANMEQFMAVLTPEQLARFFVWVNRFGSVCVQIHV